MATAVDSTRTPVVQTRLLRGGGTAPCRVLTSDELLDEIAAEIRRQEFCATCAELEMPPESLPSARCKSAPNDFSGLACRGNTPICATVAQTCEPVDVLHGVARGHTTTHHDTVTRTDIGSADRCSAATNYPDMVGVVEDRPDEVRLAVHARTLHFRRELHQALDFGFALLDAHDLPPLALDAVDLAIATLDALDGDTDLEDGDDAEHDTADAELCLGWTNCPTQTKLGYGSDDSEPSLASPERHPTVPWSGHWTARYVSRGPQDSQTRWADGARQDCEGEITDEPHDGDNEDLEAEPAEPSLGATEAIDQTAWGESGDHDRELDATDYIDRRKTVAQYEASRARRADMVALTRRAEGMRRRTRATVARQNPDTLILVHGRMIDGHAMAMSGDPL